MTIHFSPKSLQSISSHLRSAAITYREIIDRTTKEQSPGWERLVTQFDKQAKECDELIEIIDEELDCIQLGVKA